MINLHKSYVAKLRFELATTGSEVICATDYGARLKQAENILKESILDDIAATVLNTK